MLEDYHIFCILVTSIRELWKYITWQISLSMLASVSISILAHSTHNITTALAQGQGSESGWTVGTPMPSPRTEVTAVNLNDGVYVIGGFTSDDKNPAIVEMYNATSDSWRTDIAPLPVPLHHASSVSFQNKIYVVGGYMGNSTPSDRLYIYDPTKNIWTQSNSMPTPRGSPNANIVNGMLYVVGGDMNDRSLNVVESYNSVANRWATHTPMPTSRHHAASAVVDGNIYVIGGRLTNSLVNTDLVEKYDPVLDKWATDLEPMPLKRSGIAATSIDGAIYVLGGERRQGTFDNTERFDPINNTWTIESPMPTARHGLGVTASDNKIFVIGGGPHPGLTVSAENEIYKVNRPS
jgi:N-acetylneuraminic acid mutarotase